MKTPQVYFDPPLYMYITLEDYEDDLIEAFPGTYDDDEYFFENIAFREIDKHFTAAWKNLFPLLSNINFNSLSIGVDILDAEEGSASFFHGFSNSDSGDYGFMVSGGLLYKYLKAFWEKNNEMGPGSKYTWEHELTHLADFKSLTKYVTEENSPTIKGTFIQYLCYYRNEGIADLYSVLSTPGKWKQLDDVKRIFCSEMEDVLEEMPCDLKGLGKKKYELLHSDSLYDVGPHAILHCLESSPDPHIARESSSLIKLLDEGDTLDEESKIALISFALEIDQEQFILGLTRENQRGKIFIPKQDLEKIMKGLQEISEEHEEVKYVPDNKPEKELGHLFDIVLNMLNSQP